ncbi:hypothetical protein ACWEP8_28420 [Streptomyces hydrogenans]
MGASNALPIMRASDLVNAHQAVHRLLSLAIPMDKFHVSPEAQARTPAEAQDMVTAFPKATISPDDHYRPESNAEIRRMISAGGLAVATPLPVTLHLETQPVGSIHWDFFSRPAVSELGLEIRNKNAYIQIAINSEDVHQETSAPIHTVFIRFRVGDMARAEWLARQVGLQPIGPVECGW